MTTTPAKRALRPRDAATLILVDTASGGPRILMGRRRPDLAFMPNMFVFPGGRSEMADRKAPSASELHTVECDRLLHDMKGRASAARARGLAMAAIRETYEETGHLVGVAAGSDAPSAAHLPPVSGDATAPATPWQSFLAEGVVPHLAALRFFARAITPPGRPRRFDTRFFLAEAPAVAKVVPPPDAELSEVGWHHIEEVRNLDLPNITRKVVEELADLIDAGLENAHRKPVPFYDFHRGERRRRLIEAGDNIG